MKKIALCIMAMIVGIAIGIKIATPDPTQFEVWQDESYIYVGMGNCTHAFYK